MKSLSSLMNVRHDEGYEPGPAKEEAPSGCAGELGESEEAWGWGERDTEEDVEDVEEGEAGGEEDVTDREGGALEEGDTGHEEGALGGKIPEASPDAGTRGKALAAIVQFDWWEPGQRATGRKRRRLSD